MDTVDRSFGGEKIDLRHVIVSDYQIEVTGDKTLLADLIEKISFSTSTRLTADEIDNFLEAPSNELTLAGNFNIRLYRTRGGFTVGLHPTYISEASHERSETRKKELLQRNNLFFESLKKIIE